MDAAARLYREGKVRHLLVSGDNNHTSYDEPTWMHDALIERGVPASAITLDYAGFRTLDSMARAQAVFGLHGFTIVTDDFHMARSVFLARSYGLDVVGFPADPIRYWRSKKVRTRELASRTVACLEVYLLHTKPRFYGPPVKIDIAAAP
jgi:SanA protein